jgi:Acetyltransferase (GNAT) family
MRIPIGNPSEVFDATQKVKADAPAFCTNFFPVERKLQGWINHGELAGEFLNGAAFFFRRDRDFWHLYFCAKSVEVLEREIALLGKLQTERIVVDLIGSEGALADLVTLLERAGFRRYSRLQRMTRSTQSGLPRASTDKAQVVYADLTDRDAILDLLNCSFDRYADQLPMPHEIDAAIASRQMLAIKCEGKVAALLFFETQGFTSTIRYWVVSEAFRARRFGAALMHCYLEAQRAVRRFILWVVTANENAIRKYQHYGYAADGLIDHVLANDLIRP